MATIIKRETQQQHQSGNPMRSVAYDLSDFSGQADEYLDTVRAEAIKIIQEAKQESAKIREQSEAAGRKAAEDAIEKILDEKVAKQMRSLTPALASAVGQIEDSRQQWLRHWEASAVQLACSMAQRIIRQEIKHQPEISQQWIEESLRLSAGAGEITLRINPSDHATLGDQISRLAEVFRPAAPTKIVADETITQGGCRVDTEFGSIDQQIETQLARITEELE